MAEGAQSPKMLRLFCIFLTVPQLTQNQETAGEISKGVDWLTRYGYLPPPDRLTGQLQTVQGLTDAIKSMQRFAGIAETGKLDSQTLEVMKRPRCSLPDIIGTSEIMRRRRRTTRRTRTRRTRRYALAGTIWKKTYLTWRVRNFPRQFTLDQGYVGLLLGRALRVWSDVSPLQFQQIEGEADINIVFTHGNHDDGYPFDGPGGTLAHAYFPGEHPISGDTHFDDDEAWAYRGSSGTDLFAVAVHEFGHAIGLSHSSAGESIMRPYYQGPVGDAEHYRLPLDDVHGIQHLYGKAKTPESGDPGKYPDVHPDIPHVPEPSPGPKPEPRSRCVSTFDAVANIRGEAFFFKDHYFWRIQRAGNLVSLNPAQIRNFWKGLPEGLTNIDGVYERLTDNKIVFFIGRSYWVFSNTEVEQDYPRDISDFGLPVDRIDAVFVWPHNGKTYFFTGARFWRFDEQQRRMDSGYPKEISLWKGIEADLDGVMGWSDGATYFFKGHGYWQMNGGGVEVVSPRARSTHQDWLHCDAPPDSSLPPVGVNPNRPGSCSCPMERNTGSARSPALPHPLTVLLIVSTYRWLCLGS